METTARPHDDPESHRLTEDRLRLKNWKRWGPYLAERAWGTVREDYSRDGAAWDYFPHDHARSRVYRWNEDGLMGFCDRQQYICFALALWNRRDPILKERLFGLAGPEGNHGEDVKELYYYLDSTPTHSYMRALYKYPQRAYPYAELVHGNRHRDRKAPELELLDTGIFDDDRYFDVDVEYAKASPEDLLVQVTVWNRGPEAAPLDLLPTLWFRNTWSWGSDSRKPRVKRLEDSRHGPAIHVSHRYYGERHLHAEGAEDFLFTENETNRKRLWNVENESPHVKDAFHEYLVHGREDAVNAAGFGTKAAALYRLEVPAHGSRTVRLRLTPPSAEGPAPFDDSFEEALRKRKSEADQFYA
ncbi:MAG: glucosidase, partial [Acidobacteria bacterium]|nr:glucosidase [Acidobacteriota bacterium]